MMTHLVAEVCRRGRNHQRRQERLSGFLAVQHQRRRIDGVLAHHHLRAPQVLGLRYVASLNTVLLDPCSSVMHAAGCQALLSGQAMHLCRSASVVGNARKHAKNVIALSAAAGL